MTPLKPLRATALRQRNKVLQVARRLFWENGYLGTSVDDIAKAARINKASIYYYFRNKSDILFELASTFIHSLMEVVRPVVHSDLPADRKMEAFVFHHLVYSLDRLGFSGIGQRERRNLPPKLMRDYTAMRDEYEKLFRQLIEEGIARGIFLRTDVGMASRFCLGLLNSTALWFKPKGKYSAEAVAKEAYGFIMRALAPEPTRGRG
jgi:AcrR family transcriptional regulator